jgi:phosphatidylglycerol lysyltransferase
VTPQGWRQRPRLAVAWAWIVAHAARLWGFALFGAVLALSWHALRGVHTQQVRAVLRSLDPSWLWVAAGMTVANIAVMGFYDVIAFRETRTRARERWIFGAVAFCWSNFLTLGPLAGPAIRYWLYRQRVTDRADLHVGIVAIVIAFTSGLAGWTMSAWILSQIGGGLATLAAVALVLVLIAAAAGRAIAQRFERFTGSSAGSVRTLEIACIGWLDWLGAAVVFVACLRATNATAPILDLTTDFFYGQLIGLLSLVPAGFGSSDAFWIARLPFERSVTAAALGAYRVIYYIVPWSLASLVLLSWATRQSLRRIDVARRVVASLVGGGGVLIILSSASPALHARLILLERHVPLPLVEAGQVTAALAGLLLLVLARGLARGYRGAFNATMALLLLAGFASLLKGLDWEEAVVLGVIGLAASLQSGLFNRPSGGDWLEWADLGLAFAAVAVFLAFGSVSHHLSASVFERWSEIGYRLQAPRYLRSAASMLLAVSAGTLYVLLRTPIEFQRPDDAEVERALQANAAYGDGTTPLMVAVGDKAIFFDGSRGFSLYRTIGPYLAVFSDPVVRSPAERDAFLDALVGFARNLDRRPLFYQISLEWMPLLHDRGYHFFKLGEEAHVPLERLTLEGHAGKLTRQVLRRAERDRLAFRVLQPCEIGAHIASLAEISSDWLRAKHVIERQFSIGYFDPDYLQRFPCAVVEHTPGSGRIVAFANLLEGPRFEELSVDLMRYRSDTPNVMDFLLTSVMLYGKAAGYRRFNLGMAPLASVGQHRGARTAERLAGLLFRRGEQWYNFQGVRQYKQKFNPEWMPRYMAYQTAVEWPVALANVSALIAGSWGGALLPRRELGASSPGGADANVNHV